ncbi:MAG: Eco57I restriction-modification methylase domain-containing protein [Actinomycetota bacterium]|nr:Eco57I restriction-modification methylase domain-containing protein [Actinomycetota bacterium]
MATSELFSLGALDLPKSSQEAVRHGEVFTRRWVVDLILDLVGYTADRDLATMTIVEPACGAGAFLGPIVERLSASCRAHGRSLLDATNSIRAQDLLEHNVKLSQKLVTACLCANGWSTTEAVDVASTWVKQGDYLLQQYGGSVDFVVGNPPYVRLEDIPDARMKAYRAECSTMGGRADIYVGFYEIGLRNLNPGGRLGFICADRWMRNQYGRNLRSLVARSYSVDLILTMHDVDAFEERVSAYPAITIISNRSQGDAVAADTTKAFGAGEAAEFRSWLKRDARRVITPTYHGARLPHWFDDDDSWPAASPARLAVLEELTHRLPLLQDAATGTKVGIGVATGADGIFIVKSEEASQIEQDRLLPLAMVRDTVTGTLRWQGSYLVNPWTEEGNLVDLANYPGLAGYFMKHSGILRKRYVATKRPDHWYKTIDKVDHRLVNKPKLFLPDMKTTIHPVLDDGQFYPHHNLYYVVSDTWDPRVLGGLLLSKVAEAFVSAYAVKMRGGTLRFQAQYLRKIRVPAPEMISEIDRIALAEAFDRRDVVAATVAALRAYGVDRLPD